MAALLVLAAGAARGDVVQTLAERVQGDVTFLDGAVSVAGKTLSLADVLLVSRAATRATLSAPQALRLADGQVWPVQLRRVQGKKAQVVSPIAGARDIDIDTLRAIDFAANLEDRGDQAGGTLYREGGEPIPGNIIWIDAQRMALDSPLGLLTLGRDTAARYVFKHVPKPVSDPTDDELRLVDGSVLRGKVAIGNNRVELRHAIWGTISVPGAAVTAITRFPADVTHVRDLPAGAATAKAIVGTGTSTGGAEVTSGGAGVRVITIQLGASVRVPVAGGGTLAATLMPVAGARGAAKVKMSIAGKAVLEESVAPGANARPVSADLGATGGELVIEVVSAGEPATYPGGAVLADVLVIATKKP